MIKPTEIKKVKEVIVNRIKEQVETGKQSEFLIGGMLSPDYKACGQYIVKEKKQRGIHGTSAAIRVLATKSSCNDLTTGMLNYLSNRSQLDTGTRTHNYHWDDKNIIKLSEQLYSIFYMGPGRTDTAPLRDHLLSKLKQAHYRRKKNNKQGWSYFEDCEKDREVLPTAFAVMALNKYHAFYREEIEYLFQQLEKAKDYSEPVSFSAAVFSLFVLTFKTPDEIKEEAGIDESSLKKIYKKISQSKLCVLDSHIEQNVDYWSMDDEDFDIKIPWQLYYFSLTSHYSSVSFCKPKIQRLLKSIHESFDTKEEFKFPFAGKHMSVRTISIIFESFSLIERKCQNNYVYDVLYFVNNTRVVTRFFIGLLTALVCLTVIIYSLFQEKTADIAKSIGIGLAQTVLGFIAGLFLKDIVKK